MIKRFMTVSLCSLLLLAAFLACKPSKMKNSDDLVTLTAAVMHDDANGRPSDEVWLWKYLQEFHNINIEVEEILNPSAIEERRNLMFGSNSLPDLLLGLRITNADFVKYGQGEGQLLALSDYINETNTPNIVKMFNEVSGAKAAVTLGNGKIYGLPVIGLSYNMGYYNYNAWWYRKIWFEELGISIPKNLDEMLEAFRKIKTSAGKGSIPSNVIPLGGGANAQNPTWLLLSALGYMTAGTGLPDKLELTDLALVNGEPQVICYDKERFPVFLRYMHTLYAEGLISQDYFTLNDEQVNVQKHNGLYAVSSILPVIWPLTKEVGAVADWSDYWTMSTLVSQYNPTGEVGCINDVYKFNVGTFAASSKVKDPALVARFADFWYSDEGSMISSRRFPAYDVKNQFGCGVITDMKWNFDIGRPMITLSNGLKYGEVADPVFFEYINPLYPFLGYVGIVPLVYKAWDIPFSRPYNDGSPPDWDVFRTLENVDESAMNRWGVTCYAEFMPHTTGDCYPTTIYLEEQKEIRAMDLKAVITEFTQEEAAKFITGRRELNDTELTKFFADLKTLGIEEYLGYYSEAFAPYR